MAKSCIRSLWMSPRGEFATISSSFPSLHDEDPLPDQFGVIRSILKFYLGFNIMGVGGNLWGFTI